MCVHVYVCVRTCVRVCMYVYVGVCLCTGVYGCAYGCVCMIACVCVRVRLHLCILHVCGNVCICVYVYVCDVYVPVHVCFCVFVFLQWLALGAVISVWIGGWIYCTKAGLYFLDLMDHYVPMLSFFLVAILELVCVSWFYDVKKFFRELEANDERPFFAKRLW
jgi:Sodium:neurotransmitter symporter family